MLQILKYKFRSTIKVSIIEMWIIDRSEKCMATVLKSFAISEIDGYVVNIEIDTIYRNRHYIW